MLNLDPGMDRITRAQEVRRTLLGCIELLKPQGRTPDQAEAARAYAILTYRYVDGLSMQEIAEKLALSQRQTYREHTKGVKAVAGLVLDKMSAGDDAGSPASQERLSIAQAEVERLRQEVKAEVLDLPEVLAGVISTLEPLGSQLGLHMTLAAQTPWPPVVADRVMLRQALFNLLSLALNRFVQGNLEISAAPAEDSDGLAPLWIQDAANSNVFHKVAYTFYPDAGAATVPTAEANSALTQLSSDCAAFAFKPGNNTPNDSSDVDTGYRMEFRLDLRNPALGGYASGTQDIQIGIRIADMDGTPGQSWPWANGAYGVMYQLSPGLGPEEYAIDRIRLLEPGGESAISHWSFY